jgi:hypothetical protein
MGMRNNVPAIGEEIERLAATTGAPASFVERLVEFFHAKQIALSGEAEPYRAALEEAFSLEESVRRNTARARDNLIRLQECLRLVGATYQHQLGQLRRVRDALDAQNRMVREGAEKLREMSRAAAPARSTTTTIRRGFLVPGPREPQ